MAIAPDLSGVLAHGPSLRALHWKPRHLRLRFLSTARIGASSMNLDTSSCGVSPANGLSVGAFGPLHMLLDRAQKPVSIAGFQEVRNVLMFVNQNIGPRVGDL